MKGSAEPDWDMAGLRSLRIKEFVRLVELRIVQTKNNMIMRKVSFIMLTGVFFLLTSCGKSEKQFDKELSEVYSQMEKTKLTSAFVCSEVSSAWQKAIFDHTPPNGNYCSDFNDALKELYQNFSKSGITDSIAKWNRNMQEMTKKLNEHPDSRKDCYNEFVGIVSEVSSFSRMAADPSGNLRSYNQQINEAYENISKKQDQLKIKYGDFF